jgi:hypothetical protein
MLRDEPSQSANSSAMTNVPGAILVIWECETSDKTKLAIRLVEFLGPSLLAPVVRGVQV